MNLPCHNCPDGIRHLGRNGEISPCPVCGDDGLPPLRDKLREEAERAMQAWIEHQDREIAEQVNREFRWRDRVDLLMSIGFTLFNGFATYLHLFVFQLNWLTYLLASIHTGLIWLTWKHRPRKITPGDVAQTRRTTE